MSDGSLNIIEHYQTENAALQAEVQRLREMLKELEWVADGPMISYCLKCGGTKSISAAKHKPDCELAALLAEGKDK
jgi:hypothetical protein